jgi:hypothetical protein
MISFNIKASKGGRHRRGLVLVNGLFDFLGQAAVGPVHN